MRIITLELLILPILLLFGCTGDGDSAPAGGEQTANGDRFTLLADGEFIDTKPIRGTEQAALTSVPFADAVASSAAIVVVDSLEVIDQTDVTSPVKDESGQVIREILVEPITNYRAQARQWTKGGGETEIVITWVGAVRPSGPWFYDGAFLPQEGRRYLLLLGDRRPDLPGTGDYETGGFGRDSFEVTDGFVHVLNHPISRDLQEQYGGMPLADFIQVLEGYIAAP